MEVIKNGIKFDTAQFKSEEDVYKFLENIDSVDFMASAIAKGFGWTYDDEVEENVLDALNKLVTDADKTIESIYEKYTEEYAEYENEGDEEDDWYRLFGSYDGQSMEDLVCTAVFNVLDAVDKTKTVKEGFKAFYVDYMLNDYYYGDLDNVNSLLGLGKDFRFDFED